MGSATPSWTVTLYGDGTDSIIGTLGIDRVEHHTPGSQFGMGTDAANGAYER